MNDARISLDHIRVSGTAECVGGKHPDPPLDAYPLLAWHPEHPEHGAVVFAEDGSASVHALALAVAETVSYEAAADRHGTTADHVDQAVRYALEAGLLSA